MKTQKTVSQMSDDECLAAAGANGPAVIGQELFDRAERIRRINPTGALGPEIVGRDTGPVDKSAAATTAKLSDTEKKSAEKVLARGVGDAGYRGVASSALGEVSRALDVERRDRQDDLDELRARDEQTEADKELVARQPSEWDEERRKARLNAALSADPEHLVSGQTAIQTAIEARRNKPAGTAPADALAAEAATAEPGKPRTAKQKAAAKKAAATVAAKTKASDAKAKKDAAAKAKKEKAAAVRRPR